MQTFGVKCIADAVGLRYNALSYSLISSRCSGSTNMNATRSCRAGSSAQIFSEQVRFCTGRTTLQQAPIKILISDETIQAVEYNYYHVIVTYLLFNQVFEQILHAVQGIDVFHVAVTIKYHQIGVVWHHPAIIQQRIVFHNRATGAPTA